ncbi:MAG TPA: phosphatase PAP2 family protein [Blastocatellia bacterium]|nr:phosphatase PAP2 family protein [Blastocatellia bacterium]
MITDEESSEKPEAIRGSDGDAGAAPDEEGEAAAFTSAASTTIRRVYWAELVFAAALGAYAVLAVLAHRYAYFGWDVELSRTIQSIDLPGFRTAMIGISRLGSGWLPVALVVASGTALVVARRRIEGLTLMAGAGLGSALDRLLKALTARPRPDGGIVQVAVSTHYESFPSGHVLFFIEFFGFLFFLSYLLLKPGGLRRASFVVLGSLIAVIGVSRVYLGAHWPSDVVGAYLAGGMWLMLMIEAYRRLKTRL